MKKLTDMTEPEWKKHYLKDALRERNDLIPFPKDEIQVISNGLKGEQTAKAAISIWDTIYSAVSKIAISQKKKFECFGLWTWLGANHALTPFLF